MSHAHEQHGEQKKHGDVLEKALKEADEHNTGQGSAIPAPENGGHARSAAAHLNDNAHLHGNTLTPGSQHFEPMTQVNAQKQPPQEISRVGKQHRGQ